MTMRAGQASAKPLRYVFSPEFHRHLWLKFSPFRLLAGPVVPVLWWMICRKLAPAPGSFSYDMHNHHTLSWGMFVFFFLIVVVWGCYEAASALRDEVKGNTWDFLRMSSISPASLVLGKLFGATSYVWYVGLMTLPFFIYGYLEDFGGSLRGGAAAESLQIVFYMVMAGVIGHAAAFLVSFIDMVMLAGRTGKSRVPRVIGPFVMGLAVSVNLFSGVVVQSAHGMSRAMPGFYMHRQAVWYGVHMFVQSALTMSMVFALFWLLFGACRMARAELMYRTRPVSWMVFVGSLLAYLGGFMRPESAYYDMQIFALFILALGMAYGIMLLESADGRKYARFAAAVKAGDWARAFENTHKWMATVPFVLAMYLLTLSSVPTAGLHMSFNTLGFFMIALMLFALRDGLVIHMALSGRESKHVTFKLLFYYLLVYVMLPSIQLAGVTAEVVQSLLAYVQSGTQMPGILKTLAFYYPLPLGSFAGSVLPVLAEVLLAAGLLFWRLRQKRVKGKMENA
jgi:hypothetical protein